VSIKETIQSGLAEVVLNWGATRATLEQKVADAEARVVALKTRKDAVVVDAALGNAMAKTELNRIDTELTAAEAEAERMRYAFVRATERENARVEQDRIAQDRAVLKKRWDDVQTKLNRRQLLANKLDTVGKQYADLLSEMIALGLEVHSMAPRKDDNNQHQTVLSAQSAENAACVALKKQGVSWAVPHVSDIPDAKPVSEVIAAQHIEFLSHKGAQ
jgi:hypothetical protein